MFSRLDIHLTGPICACRNYNLVLIFQIDVNSKIQLAVQCKTCHEVMSISREWVSESTIISLDMPYDGTVIKRKKSGKNTNVITSGLKSDFAFV